MVCLLLGACRATPSGSQPNSPTQDAQADSKGDMAPHSGDAPGKSLSGVHSECGDWATIERGTLKYFNNNWAKNKAQGKFEQCLLQRKTDGGQQFGWSWAWPGFDQLGFAYPAIVVGRTPWSDKTTDARLPLSVSSIPRLTLSYAVDTQATGKYSLSVSLWLLTPSETPEQPIPRRIANEIIVWLDYGRPSSDPIGTQVGSPTVDGVVYELWHKASHGDRGDGKGWPIYYFKSMSPATQGVVNLTPILGYLVAEGAVDPDELVTSVEFGNELMGGEGTTWVRDFKIEWGSDSTGTEPLSDGD